MAAPGGFRGNGCETRWIQLVAIWTVGFNDWKINWSLCSSLFLLLRYLSRLWAFYSVTLSPTSVRVRFCGPLSQLPGPFCCFSTSSSKVPKLPDRHSCMLEAWSGDKQGFHTTKAKIRNTFDCFSSCFFIPFITFIPLTHILKLLGGSGLRRWELLAQRVFLTSFFSPPSIFHT